MTTFDRHLLSEWLQILFLVLAVLLGLIVVQICYNDLRSILEAGAHLGEGLWYLAVTLPGFFGVVLPLGLLISLLFSLGKLHRANELTAMRAAGVGFGRMMLPIWVIGLVACAGVWWLNSTLVPWSVVKSDEFRAAIDFRKQSRTLTADKVGAVYDVGFAEPNAGRMWFFNRFSRATGHGYGISVTETQGGPFPRRQIWAAEGWPTGERGWEFRDGREVTLDPETGVEQGTRLFALTRVPEYREDPRLMLLTEQRPVDLSIFDLHRLMRYYAVQNPSQAVPYATRYYALIADTLAPLIVIALAIPFAVTGVRVNPAVGVAKSMGLFAVYYLLDAVRDMLTAKGWLDPQVAAWIPNVSMGLLALWLFVRIR